MIIIVFHNIQNAKLKNDVKKRSRNSFRKRLVISISLSMGTDRFVATRNDSLVIRFSFYLLKRLSNCKQMFIYYFYNNILDYLVG